MVSKEIINMLTSLKQFKEVFKYDEKELFIEKIKIT